MRKIKDRARSAAERLVANGRPVGQYFQTDDEIDDEKRIAAALRRVYRKGYKTGYGHAAYGAAYQCD